MGGSTLDPIILVTVTVQVFPKLYKVDNIGNKGFHGEEQMNPVKKLPPIGIETRTYKSLLLCLGAWAK